MYRIVSGEKIIMWLGLWTVGVLLNAIEGHPVSMPAMLALAGGVPLLVAFLSRVWGTGKARAELAESEAYGERVSSEVAELAWPEGEERGL